MILSQAKLELLKNSNIAKSLIEWGNDNYRNFPWRYTFDPFRVAMSELLLRRTRASQVTDAYLQIMKRCHDMCCIYNSGTDFIDNIISHLGIKRRSGLIINAAGYICRNYNGIIPQSRELLERIPGFGDYTVSAVRVFGFGMNDPLMDANTTRIFSRIFGIKINDSIRKSHILHPAYMAALGNSDPVKFGYAILDLGALVCKTIPECHACPLKKICSHFINSCD